MLEWPEYVEAFVVLLVLFNPIGMVPIFLGLTANCTPSQRRRIALVAAVSAAASVVLSLVNPAYTGDLVWNRRTDARFHRIDRGRAVERPQAASRRLELNDERHGTPHLV